MVNNCHASHAPWSGRGWSLTLDGSRPHRGPKGCCNISLHSGHSWGKCRQIFHTWSIWERSHMFSPGISFSTPLLGDRSDLGQTLIPWSNKFGPVKQQQQNITGHIWRRVLCLLIVANANPKASSVVMFCSEVTMKLIGACSKANQNALPKHRFESRSCAIRGKFYWTILVGSISWGLSRFMYLYVTVFQAWLDC